jgi:hypothetical protein
VRQSFQRIETIGEMQMATYRIVDEDGQGAVLVNTKNAIESWNEDTEFDGRNQISKATGSQWEHETLYKSRKGNYYIVHESNWQGTTPEAEMLTRQEAARWLILNNHDLPDDLEDLAEDICE